MQHTKNHNAAQLGAATENDNRQNEHDTDAASISLRASLSVSSSSPVTDPVAALKAEARALWGTLLEITKEDIKQLTTDSMHQPIEQICHMRIICTGHNNRVFVVFYDGGTKICMRVPASGWGHKWTEDDRATLLQTVLTMKLLSKNTKMPTRYIHHYDLNGDANAIEAPVYCYGVCNWSAADRCLVRWQ